MTETLADRTTSALTPTHGSLGGARCLQLSRQLSARCDSAGQRCECRWEPRRAVAARLLCGRPRRRIDPRAPAAPLDDWLDDDSSGSEMLAEDIDMSDLAGMEPAKAGANC